MHGNPPVKRSFLTETERIKTEKSEEEGEPNIL